MGTGQSAILSEMPYQKSKRPKVKFGTWQIAMVSENAVVTGAVLSKRHCISNPNVVYLFRSPSAHGATGQRPDEHGGRRGRRVRSRGGQHGIDVGLRLLQLLLVAPTPPVEQDVLQVAVDARGPQRRGVGQRGQRVGATQHAAAPVSGVVVVILVQVVVAPAAAASGVLQVAAAAAGGQCVVVVGHCRQ